MLQEMFEGTDSVKQWVILCGQCPCIVIVHALSLYKIILYKNLTSISLYFNIVNTTVFTLHTSNL
jgi:hypothetical protein